MSQYWQGHGQTLLLGDVVSELSTLPTASVDCVITSPPYFGLRDYGMDGQIGSESSPADYVESLRKVFSELSRVLSKRGTAWLVIGDSYSGSWGNQSRGDHSSGMAKATDGRYPALTRTGSQRPGAPSAKNLLGIPWRVAFGLQDDGWILRNDIIWHKPNAMPASVTDRLSNRYEHVFLMTRSKRYDFDLDSVREPIVTTARGHTFGGANKARNHALGESARRTGSFYQPSEESLAKGKNPGDVWSISTSPFKGAHFAMFPPKLVERCLKAGCPAGGTVLDPFVGSGTALSVARRTQRQGIGIDLNPQYLDIAIDRIERQR